MRRINFIRSRKVITLTIFVLLIVFFLSKSAQNSPKGILKDLEKEGRWEGNELRFFIDYFGIIPLGEAILKNEGEILYQDKNVYHLSARAQSHKFFSLFFRAKAEIESLVDIDQLHSLLFLQHLELSNHPNEDKKIIYDQENHIMEFEGVKRVILPHTQDPLSAIFYIRKQDFEISKIFDLNLNTNQKNYRFLAKVIRRDEFKIGDRKIGVWILKGDVRRRDKSPRHSSTFIIWIVDNPAKTPILIKAMTNLGSITARLVKID